MILTNTTPAATDYDISSGTEVQLNLGLVGGSPYAYFLNPTGRPIKPIFRIEISSKTANDLTDTATYKFRLYDGVSVTFENAEQIAFRVGSAIVHSLSYVCAVAESLSPTFYLSFGDYVLQPNELMFLTMESDNAGDTAVKVSALEIYEDTDATGYSATGLDPQVDVVSANDGALMGEAEFQSSCDLALKALELDHFASVACDSNLITSNVVDNSILALALAEDGDISAYDKNTDSAEAIYNKLAAMFSAETLANLKSSFEKH